MKCQDVYGEPTVYEYPNMTIIARRPILTEEEYERRMNIIKNAARDLLIHQEEVRAKESK